jgi:ankyrin repeat protein
VVYLLLDRGAEPIARHGSGGTTALIAACSSSVRDRDDRDYLGVVRTLLKHGADANLRADLSDSAIEIADRSGDYEIAAELRKAGAKLLKPKPVQAFYDAILYDDVRAVRALLKRGVSPNCFDDAGYTPLIHACMALRTVAREEIVKLLLAHGAKPGLRGGHDGVCPPPALHEAAESGNQTIVRLLLRRGANPNEVWCDKTALCAAVQQGHYEVCKMLLAAGARTARRPDDGWTPLHWIGRAPNGARICQLLIKHGARVNARAGGYGPLLTAASWGDLKAVRVLVAAGAKVNAATSDGMTPLMAAAMIGKLDLVQFLLAKGADLNALDERNRTALSVAQDGGHEAIVELLRRAGAKP